MVGVNNVAYKVGPAYEVLPLAGGSPIDYAKSIGIDYVYMVTMTNPNKPEESITKYAQEIEIFAEQVASAINDQS